jgi:hypothetical protein
MDGERHAKAIERDAAIPAAFDVKDQGHIADTLGWS